MNLDGNVRSWLEANGFERFVELFEANEIDHEALLELTDEHLKDLGLPLGPRVKMLKAVTRLKQPVAAETRSADHSRAESVLQPMSGSAAAGAAGHAERRQLTALFCDLVGSTELSAQLDPEDLGAGDPRLSGVLRRGRPALGWPHRQIHGRRGARLLRLARGARGRGGAGGPHCRPGRHSAGEVDLLAKRSRPEPPEASVPREVFAGTRGSGSTAALRAQAWSRERVRLRQGAAVALWARSRARLIAARCIFWQTCNPST